MRTSMHHLHLSDIELNEIVEIGYEVSERRRRALENRAAECAECSARLTREAGLALALDEALQTWALEEGPVARRPPRPRFAPTALALAALILLVGGTSLGFSGPPPSQERSETPALLDGGVVAPDAAPLP
jgi:hypothetical protein